MSEEKPKARRKAREYVDIDEKGVFRSKEEGVTTLSVPPRPPALVPATPQRAELLSQVEANLTMGMQLINNELFQLIDNVASKKSKMTKLELQRFKTIMELNVLLSREQRALAKENKIEEMSDDELAAFIKEQAKREGKLR